MLSAAWLAGVLAGLSVVLDTSFLLLLAGALGLAATGFWAVRLPVMPAVLAVVLLLGVVRAEMHSGQKDGSELIGKEVIASGAIVDDPETAGRLVRFELHVSQVTVGGTKKEIDERWLVYADPPEDLVSHRGAPFFRYGDEVTVHGTPMLPEPIDGFDYASYLEAQGITATVFDEDVRVTGEGGTWWRRAIFASRGRLARSIEQAMPYPESALASAMLLGKRESLPPVLVEKFRGTGAAHLLAISGLHVGVLLAVAAGAGAWLLGRQRPTYLFVAGLIIWVYVLVAGAPPSAIRAAMMGTVYLVALGLGRPSSALPALALAAAAMTAVSPGLIRQVSFQLSFAAVGGIALALALFGGRFNWGSSPSTGLGKRLLGWATALSVVSLAATLATWPLVAVSFGEVALMGVPVSLLTVPAMAPLIGTALVAAVAGLAFQPLGEYLGWVAAAPTAYLIAVVSAFPSWTLDADWAGRPLLLAWYGGLGLALLAAQPRWTRRWRRGMKAGAQSVSEWFERKRVPDSKDTGNDGRHWPLPNAYLTLVAAAVLGIVAVILWLRVVDGPDGDLHIYFLDVGQGDSTLIVTPSGRQALIDGGPDGDVVSQALTRALPGGDKSLDLVILTHLDSDHSHGLLEVLDRFIVGAVVSGPNPTGGEMQARWEQRLEEHGITPVEVREGYSIQMDEDVELEVLNPPKDHLLGDSNNDSLALRLTYGEVSVLLTADIEEEAEMRLLSGGMLLSSTVLKVGHHGSSTSTTQRFLEAVSPLVAVVSAGLDNPYGHPAWEVVERLESTVGADYIFRTDIQGTVEVVSDGEQVWVRTEQ